MTSSVTVEQEDWLFPCDELPLAGTAGVVQQFGMRESIPGVKAIVKKNL
jgi:hypothetical protein